MNSCAFCLTVDFQGFDLSEREFDDLSEEHFPNKLIFI